METNQQNKRAKKNQRHGKKEQTDRDQREGEKGIMGEMYKGPADKDNGEGTVFGSRCWTGEGRATGGKWGQL